MDSDDDDSDEEDNDLDDDDEEDEGAVEAVERHAPVAEEAVRVILDQHLDHEEDVER